MVDKDKHTYERRKLGGLTDDQVAEISDRVAAELEDRLYAWIGRQFAKWILVFASTGAAGAWLFVKYLQGQGVI